MTKEQLIESVKKDLAKVEAQLEKNRTTVMVDGWQTQRHAKKISQLGFLRSTEKEFAKPARRTHRLITHTYNMNNLVPLQITGAEARQEFPNASPLMRKVLERSFPEGYFSQDITERVVDMDSAFAELGIDKEAFYARLEGLDGDTIAYEEIKLFLKALNEGWIPKAGEEKHCLWFYWDEAGFRLHVANARYVSADVGSRLYAKNRKIALHVADCILPILQRFHTI